MLDLQAAKHAGSGHESFSESHHSMVFARIIGSIDATIIPGDVDSTGGETDDSDNTVQNESTASGCLIGMMRLDNAGDMMKDSEAAGVATTY